MTKKHLLAVTAALLLAVPLASAGMPERHASAATAQPAATSGWTPPSGWSTIAAERTFPDDLGGMVNVKDFHAVGDGSTDDTTAIQNAITATVHQVSGGPRILYFPSGTYLISKPLLWKDAKGNWASQLTLQGENQGTTSIKLTPDAAGYGSAATPKAMIETGSLPADPAHPVADGSGNEAFDNFIFDLTIDVGAKHPGATALDYLGNNYCGLRNVTLRSSDPSHVGAVGLDLTRDSNGPCLMKNVIIDGFAYGIKAANAQYSTTFQNLELENQTTVGISNTDNVLNIENLTSSDTVPVIQNSGSFASNLFGLVTLVDAHLTGGKAGVSAIQNSQTLYARGVDATTSAYRSVIQDASGSPVAGLSVAEYDSGPPFTQFGGGTASLGLPVADSPEFQESDKTKWANVVTFGADKTGKTDSSAAVNCAIASGATTIYFPTGTYLIDSTIVVNKNVREIEGFSSNLLPGPSFQGTTVNPMLLFENTASVSLDHFRFGNPNNTSIYFTGLRYLEDESASPVTIEDSVFNRLKTDTGSVYKNGINGTGDLFINDVDGANWEILHKQNVYARQLDTEGITRKVLNQGGNLWVLGYKLEKAGDAAHVAAGIDTELGGQTEVLGGLVYPVDKMPVNQAAFVVNNSRASFIYAVTNYLTLSTNPSTPDGNFKTQVEEVQAGVVRNLSSADVATKSKRGLGVMMPLYTSQP
ncbi:hypothetical protein GCM10023322_47320 [Rugosimonospora acidiphila]|uniref:Rhamnogalacturonase A/B/Epimerase-like pectate lyase domain-containing protein n=1 Tax=Rugosimonospora acidiphila TaxID=556531 RepID=A0ABP9S530_9ACTN